MKTSIKIYGLSLIVGLLAMTSCYDLNLRPDDKVDSNKFWKTDTQIHQAMMGVYETLKQSEVFGQKFALDCRTDIGMGYDNVSYPQLDNGSLTSNTGFVLNKWQQCYQVIAQANNFISHTSPTDFMTDTNKKAYLAEARFLRSLAYFELLSFYGGVPIYDESTDIIKDYASMLKPRSSADEVRNFILADLDAAIQDLPASWPSAELGRATQGAAHAIKGRVLLYNEQYTDALAELLATCDSKYGYQLYSDYGGLFLPGGDKSSEMIFALQNIGGVGIDNGMPMAKYMGTRATFGSCWNNCLPSTRFINMYENKDGTDINWDATFPGFTTSNAVKNTVFMATLSSNGKTVTHYPDQVDQLKALYANLDPRCAATLITPYSYYLGWYANATKDMEWVLASGTNEANGFIRQNQKKYTYLWRKFVPEGNMTGAINTREHTPINFPIIRLADVYLMIAECYNKTGDQVQAANYINKVRARVNMPNITENDATGIFNRIVRERGVELAAEGLRYNDLIRWKLAGSLLNNFVQTEVTGAKYYTQYFDENKNYLWPIPFTEIEKNPSLEQNPGWE